MAEIFAKVHEIVMEASSKEDQAYMKTMHKDDIHQINGQLLSNLYESTLKRSDVNYGDIPKSAGDVEKCKYVDTCLETLNTLEELHKKNGTEEPAIRDIRLAISHLKQYRNLFVLGFKMKQPIVESLYNSTVMEILDGTTLLVISYMEFVQTADARYQRKANLHKGRDELAIANLQKFNASCENGDVSKALNYLLDMKQKAFAGASALATAGVTILCLLAIIPAIREGIFFYYNSRVKISDYLNMQADFLELNKLALEASTKSPKEKKEIAKKQDDIIVKMRKAADKIKIDHVDTNDVVKKQVKEDNSMWSLKNIEKQITTNNLNGDSLNII